MDSLQEQLTARCQFFTDEVGDLVKWEWDDRFDALLSQYSVDKNEQIIAHLEKHFSGKWDPKTISKAPKALQDRAGPFVKVRKGQLLFTLNTEDGGELMAAMWPWGHGGTISLRIMYPLEVPEENEVGMLDKIKSWLTPHD